MKISKVAKRAKDCARLIENNQTKRAFRLASKRNIELSIGNKPNQNWGFVGLLNNQDKLYARVAR